MSGAIDTAVPAGARAAKRRRMRRTILLAAPLVLLGGAGAVWKSGLLTVFRHRSAPGAAPPAAPVFVDVPEIIANLDAGPRHTSYVKLQVRLELLKPGDQDAVRAAMPRVVDLFQTYLREMRPEEIKSPDGTYRLREELIARTDIALAPVRIRNVLFNELLVQ